MIKIKAIKETIEINGEAIEFQKPEREISEGEKQTVTSMISNDLEYIYYQGDEPKE